MPPAFSVASAFQRRTVVAAAVVLLHVAVLWALQSGLLQRTWHAVVPVELISQWVDLPAPPQPLAQPTPPRPAPQLQPRPPVPQALPMPTVQTQPAPLAPPSVPTPPAVAEAPSAAPSPVAATAPPAAPPVAPAVQLPSTDADYLQNPKPAYPPLSKRMGEQGKVVLRVLINADGTAKTAQIKQSSGYDRLDQTALQTVLKWRFVPGKRAGMPEAMWFDVPINFVLE